MLIVSQIQLKSRHISKCMFNNLAILGITVALREMQAILSTDLSVVLDEEYAVGFQSYWVHCTVCHCNWVIVWFEMR